MFISSSAGECGTHDMVYLSYQRARTRPLALYQAGQPFQEWKCCDQHLSLFGSEVIGKGTSKSLFPVPSCALNCLESCLGE